MSKKSINFRRDNRTQKQFEQDILNSTNKEKFLLKLFVKYCKSKGQTITYRSNGTNNKGQLVKKSSCDADYKITIDGQTNLYDIKNSPVLHKLTFKKYQLEQYVKQDAHILVFYGTGNINHDTSKLKKDDTYFAIITPKKIQKILKECRSYKDKYFGYKECVRVEGKDFNKYFESYKLTEVSND